MNKEVRDVVSNSLHFIELNIKSFKENYQDKISAEVLDRISFSIRNITMLLKNCSEHFPTIDPITGLNYLTGSDDELSLSKEVYVDEPDYDIRLVTPYLNNKLKKMSDNTKGVMNYCNITRYASRHEYQVDGGDIIFSKTDYEELDLIATTIIATIDFLEYKISSGELEGYPLEETNLIGAFMYLIGIDYARSLFYITRRDLRCKIYLSKEVKEVSIENVNETNELDVIRLLGFGMDSGVKTYLKMSDGKSTIYASTIDRDLIEIGKPVMYRSNLKVLGDGFALPEVKDIDFKEYVSRSAFNQSEAINKLKREVLSPTSYNDDSSIKIFYDVNKELNKATGVKLDTMFSGIIN